jgi:hypothetical protein
MFHLARLISTSSRSLSATLGYAMTGVLGRGGRAVSPGSGNALDRCAAPYPPSAFQTFPHLCSNAGPRRRIAFSDQ